MDKLQKTVSSEGRFKNLRETLKKYAYLHNTIMLCYKQWIVSVIDEVALIKFLKLIKYWVTLLSKNLLHSFFFSILIFSFCSISYSQAL